jgi:hypothetical protein
LCAFCKWLGVCFNTNYPYILIIKLLMGPHKFLTNNLPAS